MRFRFFAVTGLAFYLSGCATHFAMWNDVTVPAPGSPPKIILGQTATYWGRYEGLDKAIIDSWRQTGIFKEVLLTDNPVPTTKGTFIHTSCSTYENSQDEFPLTLLYLMTLGTVPAILSDTERTCTTKFYQNGALLNTSSAKHTYRSAYGWTMWLFNSDEKVLSDGQLSAASNIVTTQLASLKKAYP